MRSLEKNKREIWFSNPSVEGEDESGNDSVKYSEPAKALVNISSPSGNAYGSENGIWLNYVYTIVVTTKEFEFLKFVEGETFVWYDVKPNEKSDNANLVVDRVAKSLNQVKIGLKWR